ncbi:MAG: FkbM family methyltransferase [Acidobacteriota bacterium]
MLGFGLLSGSYYLARSSGFLSTGVGRDLFLGSYFAYKRRVEDPYAALIESMPELFRGGHVLDVGANVGYCSVLFAGAIGANQKVYAFEPEPFNFALLERVLHRRELDGRVVSTRAAVGAANGTLRLWLNPKHHGDHRIATDALVGETVEVPVLTIDSFVELENIHPVKFIKIDVQGYEPAVCEGMSRTLQSNPECSVSLEYMPAAMRAQGYDPRKLVEWFESRGYGAHTVLPGGKLKPGVPGNLRDDEWVDLLFSPRTLA